MNLKALLTAQLSAQLSKPTILNYKPSPDGKVTIEFTLDGKKIIPQLFITNEDSEEPTELTIEEFKFMGLSNTTYFEMFADGDNIENNSHTYRQKK